MGKQNRLGAKTSMNPGRLIPLPKKIWEDCNESLKAAFILLVTHATHQPYLEVAKELLKDENFIWSSEEDKIHTFEILAQDVCTIIRGHISLKLKLNIDNVKKVLKLLMDQGISPSYLLERIEDSKFRNMCCASKEEVKNIKYNPGCSSEDITCTIILSPQACIIYKILIGEGFTAVDMDKFLNIPYDLLYINLEDASYDRFKNTERLLGLLKGLGDPLLFKIVLRSIENKPLDFFEKLLFKTRALLSFRDTPGEFEFVDRLLTDVDTVVTKFLIKHSTISDIKPAYKVLIVEASDNIAYCYLVRKEFEKVLKITSSVLKVFPDAVLEIKYEILLNILNSFSETRVTYIDKALELFIEGDLKAEVFSWIRQGIQSVNSLDVKMFEDYSRKKSRIKEIFNNVDAFNQAVDLSFKMNEIFSYARSDFDKTLDLITSLDANQNVSELVKLQLKDVAFVLLSTRITQEGMSLEKTDRLKKIMQEVSDQGYVSLKISIAFAELYRNLYWNFYLNNGDKRKYLKMADKYLDTAIKVFISTGMESDQFKLFLIFSKELIVLKSMELGLSYKKNMYLIEKIATKLDLYHLFEKFSSFVESIEKIINEIKLTKICQERPIQQVNDDNSLEIKESAKKIDDHTSAADEKSSEPTIVSPKNDVDELEVQAKTLKRPIEEVIDEEQVEYTEDESRQIALALDQYYKKLKGAKKALQEREILGIKKVHVWNYGGEKITSSAEDVITIKEDALYARFAPNFLKKIKKKPDLYDKLDYILREKGVAKDSESEGMIYLKNNYWKIRISNKKVRLIGEETETVDDIVVLVTFFDLWSHQKMDDFINSGCKSLKKSEASQGFSDSRLSAEEVELEDETMPFWPTEELGKVEVHSNI